MKLNFIQRIADRRDSFGLLITPKIFICGGNAAFFVFPATGAAEKHLVSEKTLIQRFFKGTGVVLAGIECSPKICDFRASGIPVQECDEVGMLLCGGNAAFFVFPVSVRQKNIYADNL